MDRSRQLRLGAFLRPVSIHTGAWRYPGAFPDANFNIAHYKRFAQTLERGRFDAIFLADHLAVLNMPMDALKRSATTPSFEPMTLLSALAAVTDSQQQQPPAQWSLSSFWSTAQAASSIASSMTSNTLTSLSGVAGNTMRAVEGVASTVVEVGKSDRVRGLVDGVEQRVKGVVQSDTIKSIGEIHCFMYPKSTRSEATELYYHITRSEATELSCIRFCYVMDTRLPCPSKQTR